MPQRFFRDEMLILSVDHVAQGLENICLKGPIFKRDIWDKLVFSSLPCTTYFCIPENLLRLAAPVHPYSVPLSCSRGKKK